MKGSWSECPFNVAGIGRILKNVNSLAKWWYHLSQISSAFCWTFLIAGVDSQIVEEDPQPNRETLKGQSVGMLEN